MTALTSMEQDEDFPDVEFRIDGNSLFVAFDETVKAVDEESIVKALADERFDNSRMAVKVVRRHKRG